MSDQSPTASSPVNPGLDLEERVSTRRTLTGKYKYIIYVVTTAMALFHLYVLAAMPLDPWLMRIFHLQFVMIIGFLSYAGSVRSVGKVKLLDLALIAMTVSYMLYALWDYDELLQRLGVYPEQMDVLFSLFAVVAVLELTRRTVGWTLTILALVFIGYCFVGPYLPGILWHKGYSTERILTTLFSTNGIFNIPVGVTARFVYLFVLFGAFLEISGASSFFMDAANAISGRARGGPAKVAIISSGLLGMVSGTATGNVVTTGTLTIPLMKRTGYDPFFAGAVEATASTGGQIMPPVMGAAVFLMAQMLEIPYSEIMFAAALPAVLYYAALYFTVDFEADRIGLVGCSGEGLHSFRQLLPRCYLALPLLVLMGYILSGSSVVLAGLMGLGAAFVVSCVFIYQQTGRIPSPMIFIDGFRLGGINIIQISATCATAGMIMGVLSLTGLGTKIAGIVIALSQGSLLIALILTMVVTIILGMGLPTLAAYAIPASVIAPALIKFGVPEMAAHLFVLYYACLSAITPPVALASYAAAAIAGVSPFRLSCISVKLGLAGFIIPYMFVFGPQLLLIGSWHEILFVALTATIGVYNLAICVVGHCFTKVAVWKRALFFMAALLLIKPGIYSDGVGVALMLVLILSQFWLSKRSAQPTVPKGEH